MLEQPRPGLKPCAEKPKPTKGAGIGGIVGEKDMPYGGLNTV